MPGRPKKTERNAQILAMYREGGRSPDQIGAAFGLQADNVRNILRRAGVSFRIERRTVPDAEVVRVYMSPLSAVRTAKKLGISEKTVRDALKRQGVRIRGRSEAQRIVGAYPLRLRAPADRTFCEQCQVLRFLAEIERCTSKFCKPKARAA